MQTAETRPMRTVQSRVLLAAMVLLLESLAVASLPHPWFHPQQVMAAPIAAGAALLLIIWRNRQLQQSALRATRWLVVWLHAFTFVAVGVATYLLLHGTAHAGIWVGVWYLSISALIVTLALALFPLRRMLRVLGNLRWGWLWIALATAAVMSARTAARWVWNAPDSRFGHLLQMATFASVKALLGVFYAQVVTKPGTVLLGTPRFQVLIAGECSGIEGLTLVLVFTLCWLAFARRELRLMRALLLVPVVLALSWLLNTARIAALIALGDAGYGAIAINGFHSEAGWILFNVVAVMFLLAAQRINWLRKSSSNETAEPEDGRNVAAPYLLPFLAVLATAMLTHAITAGFDWLYPLRLIVGAAVLFHYRSSYRQLDWRFGWLGPLAGVLVFALWLGADRVHASSASRLANQLHALAAWQRGLWIAARVFAAIATVPIAEELAFRGYLARRIVSGDVDALPFARLSAVSIVASSVAFGLLHGRMWMAGIAAGTVFALVAKLRNRLGEAVAAHATANLLIAAWVLVWGDYRLW